MVATLKQRRVARRIVKALQNNEEITGGEIVAQSGYSPDRARKPGEVMNSEGVRDELGVLGFNVDKAKEVVGVILGDEKQKAEVRLKAADMVFKVGGTYAAEKHATVNVDIDASAIDVLGLATKAAELLREQKL